MDYRARARQIAVEEGVHPDLFEKLVQAESGFNPSARSKVGAVGLAQLMPGTAGDLGVDANDPEQNLRGGAKYLRQQIDRFKSTPMALAAYNAGPARVARAGGVPRIPETEAYVKRINGDASAQSGADIFSDEPEAADQASAPAPPSIRRGTDGTIEIDINEGHGGDRGSGADIFADATSASGGDPAAVTPKSAPEPYNKGVWGETADAFNTATDAIGRNVEAGRKATWDGQRRSVGERIARFLPDVAVQAGREASIAGNAVGAALSPVTGLTRALITKPAAEGLSKILPRAYERQSLGDVLGGLATGTASPRRQMSPERTRDTLEGEIGMALSAGMPAKGAPVLPKLPARASQRVAAALERAALRDDTTLAEMAAKASQTPDIPAFQAGGENITGLAEVAAQSPGKASTTVTKAVRNDQAAAHGRVKDSIASGLGGANDYFATIDKKVADQAARAEPSRQRAFSSPVDPKKFDSDIAPLLPRIPQKAFGYAMEIAKRDGVSATDLGIEMPTGPRKSRTVYETQTVTERGPLGEPVEAQRQVPVREELEPETVVVRRPTMQTLHYIKKGIDQELEAYRNQITGKLETGNGLGSATAELRSQYGKALRNVNPDYDEFMNLWGDDSSHLSALELGKDVLSGSSDFSSERLAQRVGEMNPVEKDFYRKGVGEAVLAQARKKGGVNAMRQLLKGDETGDRVRLAFPDEKAFSNFMDAAETEVVREARNNRVLNNSRTFGRQAAADDLKEQGGLDPLDVVSGAVEGLVNIPSIPGKALKAALKAVPRKDRSVFGDPAMNELLGKALTDPDEMTKLLNVLEAVKARRTAPLSLRLADASRKAAPVLLMDQATAGEQRR